MFERLRLVGETADHHYRLPLTQAELGDALGISEVYANRMLRRLQNERLIVSHQRILRIPNLDALKRAAAFDARYLHLDGAPQAVRDALSSPRRVAGRCVKMPQIRYLASCCAGRRAEEA